MRALDFCRNEALRWLAIRKSEAAIREQTTAVLRGASDAAEAQLREFLDHLKENLLQVATDGRIGNALRAIAPVQGLTQPMTFLKFSAHS